MKERLDYIDKAKGLLIILVVIGHIRQSGYVFNVIYAFHMSAFFAVSGLLLSHTGSYRKPYLKFALSRLYSFVIPFLFIEFLGCLTDIVRHGINQNIFGYAYNTLTLHFNDPNLWFLFTLFWVELLFTALRKLLRNDRVILCICGVTFLASLLIPGGNKIVDYVINVFRYIFLFALGFSYGRLAERNNAKAALCAAAVVLLFAGIFGRLSYKYMDPRSLLMLVTALCGTYAVLQFGKLKLPGKLDRLMCEIGKNTIIIYGTHHLYYAAVGKLLGVVDYSTTPVFKGALIFLAVAVLEIPTIYIINRWLPFLAGKKYKRKEKTA